MKLMRKEDAPVKHVVSLREGIKKVVSEVQEQALEEMREEVKAIVDSRMQSLNADFSKKMRESSDNTDARFLMEEIREIRSKIADMNKRGSEKVSDEDFRDNLIKSVDEAVREKLMEIEKMKSSMGAQPAAKNVQAPTAQDNNMKEISQMILTQFSAIRQQTFQEMNNMKAQIAALKASLDRVNALEKRIEDIEHEIMRKMSEPVIIE